MGLAAFDGRRRWTTTTAVVALGFLPGGGHALAGHRPGLRRAAGRGPGAIANPVDVQFGQTIRLLGYDLPPTAAPGQPLAVTLYWQADAPPDESYVLALRLLDPTGRPVSAIDTLPAAGRYSTTIWSLAGRSATAPLCRRWPPTPLPVWARCWSSSTRAASRAHRLPVTAGGAAAGHEARLGAIEDFPGRARRFATAADN